MLAALNHPHIGAIYGLERVDGSPALVLELVEGETLADRIAQTADPRARWPHDRPASRERRPHRSRDRSPTRSKPRTNAASSIAI